MKEVTILNCTIYITKKNLIKINLLKSLYDNLSANNRKKFRWYWLKIMFKFIENQKNLFIHKL